MGEQEAFIVNALSPPLVFLRMPQAAQANLNRAENSSG